LTLLRSLILVVIGRVGELCRDGRLGRSVQSNFSDVQVITLIRKLLLHVRQGCLKLFRGRARRDVRSGIVYGFGVEADEERLHK